MSRGYEYYERIMNGEVPTRELVEEMLARKVPEGTFLDYKRGAYLKKVDGQGKRRDPAAELRKDLSAFANADGGLLIIGAAADEHAEDGKQWDLAPCEPSDLQVKDAAGLEQWAHDVLQNEFTRLQPPPRVHAVGNELLVIAVARAQELVPVRYSGESRYFLRFGDGSRPVPTYLLNDLLLGRRSRPLLKLHHTRFRQSVDSSGVGVGFTARVANVGLSWSQGGKWTGLAYGGANQEGDVTHKLRQHCAVEEVGHNPLMRFQNVVFKDRSDVSQIAPLEEGAVAGSMVFSYQDFPAGETGIWRASGAVIFVARDAPILSAEVRVDFEVCGGRPQEGNVKVVPDSFVFRPVTSPTDPPRVFFGPQEKF